MVRYEHRDGRVVEFSAPDPFLEASPRWERVGGSKPQSKPAASQPAVAPVAEPEPDAQVHEPPVEDGSNDKKEE